MAETEYNKDFNAFRTLYSELIERYEKSSTSDSYFDLNYLDDNSQIQRFIRNWDNDLVRIPGKVMDTGLDLLLNMEKALNKLSQ